MRVNYADMQFSILLLKEFTFQLPCCSLKNSALTRKPLTFFLSVPCEELLISTKRVSYLYSYLH